MKQFIAIVVFCSACGADVSAPPADLIEREQFVQVMADAQLIEARVKHEVMVEQRTDSPAQGYYEEMYTERKITAEQYEHTYQWYVEHPEDLKDVYDAVVVELGRRKEKSE
jgi:Domain of unknown function (DUF4296)